MFFRAIDWKKFLKWLISVPAFFIFLNLINPHPTWSLVPIVSGLWILALFMSAYPEYLIQKSKIKLSLKQVRMMKLKKINRKNKWKV